MISGLGRCPGEENGYPLQYFYLGNSMDRGAQQVQSMGHKESGTSERLKLTYLNTLTEFKIGAKNRNYQCYMISTVVLSVLFHHNGKI